MSNDRNRVCPVELAGSLDIKLRAWVQNPYKILKPYIIEGTTVLDMGCGPGFFSIPIANLVGNNGKVIAADMQEGMLQKVKDKIKGTELENRIITHKCQQDRIGITDKVDFILTFFMVHEVPDKKSFFKELQSILSSNGRFLIVEPKIHVSANDFNNTLQKATEAGLKIVDRPKFFFSHSVLLGNK